MPRPSRTTSRGRVLSQDATKILFSHSGLVTLENAASPRCAAIVNTEATQRDTAAETASLKMDNVEVTGTILELAQMIKDKRKRLTKGTQFTADNGQKVALDQIHSPNELADRGKECWLLRVARGTSGGIENTFFAGVVKELRVNAETRMPESYVYIDPRFYVVSGEERDEQVEESNTNNGGGRAGPSSSHNSTLSSPTSGWYDARYVYRRLSLLDMLQRETKICPMTRILMEAPVTDYLGYLRHTGPIFYTEDPAPRLRHVQQKVKELLLSHMAGQTSLPMSNAEADAVLKKFEQKECENATVFYYEKHHESRLYAQEQLLRSVQDHHGGVLVDPDHEEVEVSATQVHQSLQAAAATSTTSVAKNVVESHKQEMVDSVIQRHGDQDETANGMKNEERDETPPLLPGEEEAAPDELLMPPGDHATNDNQKDEEIFDEANYIAAVITKMHNSHIAETMHTPYDPDGLFIDFSFEADIVGGSCGQRHEVICSDCDPKGDNSGYVKMAEGTAWRRPWSIERMRELQQKFDFPEMLVAPDGIHESDIRQHNVGDCWFTSILASCAYREDPNFVPRLIEHCPELGFFTVKLVIEGQYRWLLLDDFIPVEKTNPQMPKFVSSATLGELWPVFVEKAFAKWAGCYQNLRGGLQNVVIPIGSGRALEALTCGSEVIEIETLKAVEARARSGKGANFVANKRRATARLLSELQGRNFVMTAGGCDNGMGLIPGHVFSLLDVCKVEFPRGPAGFEAFLTEFSKTPISDAEREAEKVLHFVNETGVAIRFRHFSREQPTRGRGGLMAKTTKKYDFKLEGTNGKLKWCYETATSAKEFKPDEILEVKNGDTISFKQPNQVQGSQIRKMSGHEETATAYRNSPAGKHWLSYLLVQENSNEQKQEVLAQGADQQMTGESNNSSKEQAGAPSGAGALPPSPSAPEEIELIKIRNPWGHGEWVGMWGDGSPVWDYYPEIQKKLQFIKADDGVFFQQWEDFEATYATITACGHVEGSPLTMPDYGHSFLVTKSASQRKDLKNSGRVQVKATQSDRPFSKTIVKEDMGFFGRFCNF
ncbi:unnamed protein product [Amoebophrya sp. A120]|nr:unnamed protein product [Amoebophrya sp. A120]|eukprot:GSA120T00016067001.1